MNPLVGQLLTLLIMLWGFSIMFRGILPGRGSRSSGSRVDHYQHGRGCLPSLLYGVLFYILVPLIKWTAVLAGRAYNAGVVGFIAMISGIPRWREFDASVWKWTGATCAFLAYNCFLYVILELLLAAGDADLPDLWSTVGLLVAGVVLSVVGRGLIRRMW